MDINTGNHPPICQKPYTLALKHYEWVQKEVEQLERAGIITRSVSPWASPIVIVLKKLEPDKPPRRRMCIDFRRLNALKPTMVKVDSKVKGNLTLHPLLKIDELYVKLNGTKIFSALDLTSGYYHIELDKDSHGKWELNMVPFGLAKAPAYFQAVISTVLEGLSHFAIAYLDNIIIFSKNEEEHLQHLEIIFERLHEAGLKLKRSKCSFMKMHIEYLGHLISEMGIELMPDRLSAIKEMPAPRNPKEIKQFLGLVGYYRKFIPRFSDIAKPQTRLTRHDMTVEWCKKCEFSFQTLKDALYTEPILKFPDPNKLYVLFTDASKQVWAGVLTQPYSQVMGGKLVTVHHPVTYMSGLFRGFQLNWAALTKEAYAIYMSVKNLNFYLTDVEITLRSDHLPLKKFLLKNTLNSKVNNWAVELETFNIHFEHISGIWNTLADTVCRIVRMDPDMQQKPEKQGYEFRYSCFEELPPAEVSNMEETITKGVKLQPKEEIRIPETECTLLVPTEKLHTLKLHDGLCQKAKQVGNNTDMSKSYYIDADSVLRKLWQDNEEVFNTIVLPKILINPVLQLAHDSAGHNRFQQVYLSIQ